MNHRRMNHRHALPSRLHRPALAWRAAAWLCLGCMASAMAAAQTSLPAHPAVPAIPRIPLPARPVMQSAGESTSTPKEGDAAKPAPTTPPTTARGEQLREAIEKANNAAPPASSARPNTRAAAPAVVPTPQFTFKLEADKKNPPPKRRPAAQPVDDEVGPVPPRAAAVPGDEATRQYIRARNAALGAFAATPSAAAAVGVRPAPRNAGNRPSSSAPIAPPPWSYQGAGGPLSWGQLKPEYATCASGQRQSPIAIDDNTALLGPAEPLAIDYQPGSGSVVHTGRLLQVDVPGDNTLTVRGTRYKLERVEFHHPAEERINGKGFAMSAHLLHRSADGRLANVAVLLEPGAASPLIDQVVTYLPLEAEDRVGLPPTGLDLNTLLPQDRRYYQFFGSLSTPPCTEDVLWIVFKEPMPVSAAQLRLFGQLFSNNIRPLQPVNGRLVRAAQ